MFTGIIQEIGNVIKIDNINCKKHLTIKCKNIQSDLQIGESIACNGICLTVIKYNPNSITVEIMNQTLKITTANKWKLNTSIHLEKAMSASGRFNGHIVQGHVDIVAKLIKRFYEAKTLYLEFIIPSSFLNNSTSLIEQVQSLLVEHGSICIDGVSLTIANIHKNTFQVALIEHTLSLTHLGKLKTSDEVNLEFDIIGKYINKQISLSNLGNTKSEQKNIVTEEWLLKEGF